MFITLRDAQKLQFDLAPAAARRESARSAGATGTTNTVNAILVRLLPGVDANRFAQDIVRWKHLAALTQDDQEAVLARSVIDRARRQIGLFTTLLLTVSTVIVGLIIYTMTIDKKKAIATLKLIGAPDRRIVGLIVQQAIAMGVISFVTGAALISAGHGYFPRRVVLEPADSAALFGVVIIACLLASALGVRTALKIDPASALAGSRRGGVAAWRALGGFLQEGQVGAIGGALVFFGPTRPRGSWSHRSFHRGHCATMVAQAQPPVARGRRTADSLS